MMKTKQKNKVKIKRDRKEEEIEYTTEEEIFLPKPISRNGQASFNNENGVGLGVEQGARGGRGFGGELRSLNSVNNHRLRENYDFDEITQGELTLDKEITEPKCNGI
jgi:hypothetical protein